MAEGIANRLPRVIHQVKGNEKARSNKDSDIGTKLRIVENIARLTPAKKVIVQGEVHARYHHEASNGAGDKHAAPVGADAHSPVQETPSGHRAKGNGETVKYGQSPTKPEQHKLQN